MLTTPPPRLDPVAAFPELAPLARTTVRLHPRRAPDGPIDASKMGGNFLWPLAEPWPADDESRINEMNRGTVHNEEPPILPGTSIPYAPILQLRAEDFPEMPFPAGADLFQLLWFPYWVQFPPDDEEIMSILDHRTYWRRADGIGERRSRNPAMVRRFHGEFAHPCRLHPERVTEYPSAFDLNAKLERRINKWKRTPKIADEDDEPIDYYHWECSVCPSTKIGGYLYYIQGKHKPPTCACGRGMDHLLTVALDEWSGCTEQRWRPIEEGGPTGRSPGNTPFDNGRLTFYLYVCRTCPDFPTRARTER